MAERVDDLPVGKGNPPAATRYKKDQSGNPAGRPKGRKNLKTIVRTVAQEMQHVDLDGERRELPTSALLIVMLQRRAFRGDYGAKLLLDEVREKYGVPEEDKSTLPAIIIPKQPGMEEFLVMAAAQRKRMLWAQEQRLKDEAAAK